MRDGRGCEGEGGRPREGKPRAISACRELALGTRRCGAVAKTMIAPRDQRAALIWEGEEDGWEKEKEEEEDD